MPQLTHQEHSRFSPKQLFDLVADIEQYSNFLPWCRAARITKIISETEMLAELVIGFKGITERYSSNVALHPPEAANSECKIEVDMVEGPFQYLENHWIFTPNENGGTDISLKLNFEFKSKILNAMIGGVFAQASNKMIGAFRQRARELYL